MLSLTSLLFLFSRGKPVPFVFVFVHIPYCYFQIFNIYIKRAAEIFGVTHTREIYEKAIEVLDDDHSR